MSRSPVSGVLTEGGAAFPEESSSLLADEPGGEPVELQAPSKHPVPTSAIPASIARRPHGRRTALPDPLLFRARVMRGL